MKERSTLRIGTRGSKLALWQANYLKTQLASIGVPAELHIIKTQGDRIQHLSFDKMEGKGFFTKELEDALLRGDIDLAVHSMKDLPTEAPEGLCIAGVSERADPADWLLKPKSTKAPALLGLPEGARVGTSSARRKALLLHFRPDLQFEDIRGNVPTRLRKLQEGQVDAIVLAAAGLQRLELDLSAYEVTPFNRVEFVPAPAQGVLAYQTESSNKELRRIIQQIHRSDVSALTNVERKVLKLLGGGCHMPLGVHAKKDEQGYYHVWAAKADTWNGPVKTARLSSSTTHQLAEKDVAQLQS